MDEYCIVTNGDLALGYKKEETRKNLSQLCKYDSETLDQLFSGFPFTFKTGLDAAAAERYKVALDRTGIDCRIEKVVQEIKIEIDTHDSHAISHHPRDQQELQMICPKCGEKQPKRLTCGSCGVVIDKFRRQQKEAPVPHSGVRHEDDKHQKTQRAPWLWILGLLCAGAFIIYKTLVA